MRQLRQNIFSAIALSACISSCASVNNDLHSELPSTLYLQEVVNNFDVGSCTAEGRRVNLGKLKKIERKSIRLNTQNLEAVYVVRNDVLIINNNKQQKIIYASKRLSGTPDIDMQFATMDNVTVLYWRETYKNRRYRQGIFNIVEDDIVSYCEGMGGHDRQN